MCVPSVDVSFCMICFFLFFFFVFFHFFIFLFGLHFFVLSFCQLVLFLVFFSNTFYYSQTNNQYINFNCLSTIITNIQHLETQHLETLLYHRSFQQTNQIQSKNPTIQKQTNNATSFKKNQDSDSIRWHFWKLATVHSCTYVEILRHP